VETRGFAVYPCIVLADTYLPSVPYGRHFIICSLPLYTEPRCSAAIPFIAGCFLCSALRPGAICWRPTTTREAGLCGIRADRIQFCQLDRVH